MRCVEGGDVVEWYDKAQLLEPLDPGGDSVIFVLESWCSESVQRRLYLIKNNGLNVSSIVQYPDLNQLCV